MKQTAVQWLDYQLFIKHGKITMEDINKAKAMEKEQIIDAYDNTNSMAMNGEQYYNETFKSETFKSE